ncbi:MAG: polysaccharide pyruvyl transferase family protein [Bacteroidetes bacterium]|nr:polysaccharide pyruvyl transferase family protein [Bacteroidota bacterium]
MKIAVVNVWGSNRGDEAMISSLLCHLESRRHDVELHVRGWLDVDRFNVKILPWITEQKISKNKLVRWITFKANYYFGKQLFKIMSRNLLRNYQDSKTFDYDFVISSPAGPYFGDMYPATEHKCLLPLHICNTKNIPYGILAVSCGPFTGKRWNKIRENTFEKAVFWTVRENISYDYLDKLNLKCEKYAGSDLVFAHPYRETNSFLPDNLKDDYMEQMSKFETPTIIIVLNQTGYFTAEGANIPFDINAYGIKMGEFLSYVQEVAKCKLVIFSHFYGNKIEIKNIENVIKNSKCSKYISVLNPKYNAEMQMSLYKKAVFCVSHRYHPTIFSIKARCPFFCIKHQFKADGLLQRFGDDIANIHTYDSLSDWKVAFKKSWDTREGLKKAIDKHLVDYNSESVKHLNILDKYINRNI